jgi:(heptosyl)LPS beta-1,4-glucosyltransferase
MSSRLPLTAIIITLNESDRLPRALASLTWVDQLVVVDAGSTDGTQEIATAAGAEVVSHRWEGYSAQKAFAVTLARHTWVLWIDADEEVSDDLRRSIQAVLRAPAAGDPGPRAYAMNRRSWYLGRFLRFGGWYPDRKVRLFRRDSATFDGSLIHEELRVAGPVGFLRGDLLHYSYRNLEHHIRKTHEMARLWAEQHGGRRVAGWEMVVHPAAKALKSYLLRGGILEGWRGLIVAGMASYSVWLKYALVRERQTFEPASPDRPDAPRDSAS